ncbi:response regulator transcription factor [Hansschlegelia zhihuaiae]|uniref:Response regulator transcription factor n=1 Tax=Hansschlegelia zhihuaiae TaxID=405005 RepID=A0A4Q0MIQ2_9HYPH|nr:response regulator transcription factor [Hansschlegelia zhihuaiae]RXF73547.1 response regulator transcription factor [Hansschlegelia zhihuaiae]
MRILVIEDEQAIADDVARALESAGYVVEVVGDGEAGWYRAGTESYCCVVLDLGLPRLDGLTVLRRLRAEEVLTPVLILTARGAWMERVEGIDAGADDYLPKPFQTEELVARVGALVRRAAGLGTPVIEAGGLRIDTRRLSVSRDGRSVDLSSLEFRAINYLAHRKGCVVSQGELMEHVYGAEREPDSNAIEVLIGRLRRKVGADAIMTRRGQGYLFGA